MVDRVLIGRKIAQIDIYLNQIKEFSNISVAEYRNDWKTQRIVERTLQMLIETCIDIANHIISDRGFRMPASYADIFAVLMENKIIDERLFKNIEKMVKFKNIIVHQYESIDPSIVVSILYKNLDDFEGYKKAILKYLSEG